MSLIFIYEAYGFITETDFIIEYTPHGVKGAYIRYELFYILFSVDVRAGSCRVRNLSITNFLLQYLLV